MSEYYKDEHRYDDILHLPHHRSTKRAHMSLHDRAAQFSPFAALTGHEAAIEETARLTEKEISLDDTEITEINHKLYEIAQHLSEKWKVSITYFKSDERKQGGAYLTDVGIIRKINETEQLVIMDSGMCIKMKDIVRLEVV